ncbi:DUF4832 domain-containing protein [Balneolales bacterium ANBcel1]|nr:DUF4832 domain-containing protein [Balneolales bacterium ANBcel1]
MVASASEAAAQEKFRVQYEPTDKIFLNPERGFYFFTDHGPDGSLLSASVIESQKMQYRSLVMRNYTLSDFRDSDISDHWLDRMDRDFQTIRDSGIKAVLRFRYTTSMDEPDAPLHMVERHLEQLAPVLERNADVIAVMEAGFIGAWGEWHASSHGLNTNQNMTKVLQAILEALPERRMVNVRTPAYKANIFGTWDPVTEETAYDGSDFSRTGHHNDGFLASANDLGTYRNVEFEKNFLSRDTRFVPMGGETGGGGSSAVNEFRQCGFAIPEMDYLNWSYLNSGWYGPTLELWEEQGCMDEVKRRLGYRFVLQEGVYSEEVAPGQTFSFDLTLKNEGFASPYNPRDVRLILRNALRQNEVWEIYLDEDPRFWHGGEEVFMEYEIGIPDNMPEGTYQLLLMLPDPEPELHHRPDYAIRLANEGVWEPHSGMNDLMHFVTVGNGIHGEEYDGNWWFSEWRSNNEPTSSRDIRSEKPETVSLDQNYPNPFNSRTRVQFSLPETMNVRLDIFDSLGRHVGNLVDGVKGAGVHSVYFDAAELPSGIYISRLSADNVVATGKMLHLK